MELLQRVVLGDVMSIVRVTVRTFQNAEHATLFLGLSNGIEGFLKERGIKADCRIARSTDCTNVPDCRIAGLLDCQIAPDCQIARLSDCIRLPDCWIVRQHHIAGLSDCIRLPDGQIVRLH